MKLKRLQVLFLTVVMIFSMTVNLVPAYAVPSDSNSGVCPHHTQHIGCSYQEGDDGLQRTAVIRKQKLRFRATKIVLTQIMMM